MVLAAAFLAVAFPFTFRHPSIGIKNRIGLFGASAVGFLVALAFGSAKHEAMRHSLVLYADAMLCLCAAGILMSASIRGVPAGVEIDTAVQKKIGLRAVALMVVVGVVAYGLEFI
ncbi:hypothetical protein [Streptacidiphilus sp. P02-A3a]|uniref:hypothetical protein n=1 Tax=Streptacidiphilus sp. P02-A3a TaxID=2704468 RepID=UPI0015F8ACAA|nr:hypothetical protein [Streptacidiphilus sp. P02-A3a]QMU71748.1 hypothetical protein GXP74_29370 [Streptacidiphilus sp. P02-A3a]